MARHRVFISYSHQDRAWLEALQVHLRPLEREGRITRWDDTLIQGGDRWRREIRSALSEAKVAVLLVSKHFLASDFIAENELPPLLCAAERDGALILPVLLGPCRFDRTPALADYQAANPPDRTLMEMTEAEQDRIWLELTYRIEDALAAETAANTRSRPRVRGEMEEGLPNGAIVEPRSPTRGGLGTLEPMPGAGAPVPRPAGGEATAKDRFPDVFLLVRQEIVDNRPLLSFQLKTRDPRLALEDRLYGPVALAMEPRPFFSELFRDIEGLDTTTDRAKEIARRKLEGKGSFLFESLIPADLAGVLWELQGKIGSLLIQSEEGIIPWELFKLLRRSASKVEEGPFLCEAFAMGRWITGYPLTTEIDLDDVAWIAPAGLNDTDRGDAPDALATPEASVTIVPATFLDVHDALASGKFGTLHFSTSSRSQGNPSQWQLYLEDREALAPEDLVGVAANLGKRHPLIFLNACHTGLNAQTITGVSGWATQFIHAGCGAFIGAYWNLHDRSADRFQYAFYRSLVAGRTLGESVRHARQKVKSQGSDLTWLAYTLYGNPAARRRRPVHSSV